MQSVYLPNGKCYLYVLHVHVHLLLNDLKLTLHISAPWVAKSHFCFGWNIQSVSTLVCTLRIPVIIEYECVIPSSSNYHHSVKKITITVFTSSNTCLSILAANYMCWTTKVFSCWISAEQWAIPLFKYTHHCRWQSKPPGIVHVYTLTSVLSTPSGTGFKVLPGKLLFGYTYPGPLHVSSVTPLGQAFMPPPFLKHPWTAPCLRPPPPLPPTQRQH